MGYNKLFDEQSNPIIIDSSILMVGIHFQNSDSNFSFDKMKNVYLDVLFNYFEKIIIHQEVYNELDDNRKMLVNQYLEKNVKIVNEDGMYGKDPNYTDIFNKIAKFDMFNYRRGESKNKGEVYSLAYAAYKKIPFFSVRDGAALLALKELPELKDVQALGFEKILALSFITQPNTKELRQTLKSLYKSQCQMQIREGLIPETFGKYLETL